MLEVAWVVQQHYARTSKNEHVFVMDCAPLLGEVLLLLELVTSSAAAHWLYSCSYCIAAIAIVGQELMRDVYDARGSYFQNTKLPGQKKRTCC